MTNFEEEFLGPFFYNSTIVCLNASRLIYSNANFSLSSSPLGERMAGSKPRDQRKNKHLILQLQIMMTSSSVLKTRRMTWDNMLSASGTYPSLS